MEKTALEQALDQLEQAIGTVRAALANVEGGAAAAGDAAQGEIKQFRVSYRALHKLRFQTQIH